MPALPTTRLTRSTALDALAVCALAGYAALLLRATLLRGDAMLGFDLFTYFHPNKVFAAEALRRGDLPLWNPATFFGAPFLANVQMGVLYPLDLVFVVVEFARAVAISQWLHLSLAGAGMYVLCRTVWRLGHLPSTTGALAFAGGGFFGAHMGHLNQVHTGTWLPWIALSQFALARSLGRTVGRRPAARALAAWPWALGGGGAVALQLTAGHTQEAYYALLSLGLLAAAFVVVPPAWAPSRLAHAVALPLIALNGVLLAAAQIVPALELSRLSYRQGGLPLEEAVAFGVERTYLLESLLPTFWSLPSQEVTGYVGVVAVTLAAAALASAARRTVVALAALALFAITLTLGGYTPLFVVLHRWLPLFDSFRAPGRWLLVSSFAIAALAAHGLDALRFHPSAVRRERAARRFALAVAALAGGSIVFAWRSELVHAIHWLPHARVAVVWLGAALGAAALALAGTLTAARWPAWVIVGALGLELAFAAREMEYNHPGAPELYRDPPGVARLLAADSAASADAGDAAFGAARTLSLAVEERLDAERLRRAVPNGDAEYRRYAAMREVVRPNLGTLYGLPTIDGYDGGLLPLKSYADFKSLLIVDEPPVPHFTMAPQSPARPSARLLGTLDVRYLLVDGRGGPPGAGWAARDASAGAAWLYENADVLPRGFVVSDVRAEPDPQRALALLRSLDLRASAVVERPPPGESGSPPEPAPGRAARVLRYSATSVEVEAEGPGLLVLTETYYPGWHATVDGRPVGLLRADLHFRAVPLAAGSHDVRVWYDPLSVKAGFAVSAVALAANAGAVWLRGRRRGASA